MNYLILYVLDGMYKEGLVITPGNRYNLSSAEIYYLKGNSKCWFDSKRITEYIKAINLLPCTVIDCTDENLKVNIVSC